MTIRLPAFAALAGALALTACNDPQPPAQPEVVTEAPVEAVPAEDAATDVAATVPVAPSATDRPPAASGDTTTLPPEKRSSEETVQPESETLFY